jgi:hypothetical protein
MGSIKIFAVKTLGKIQGSEYTLDIAARNERVSRVKGTPFGPPTLLIAEHP